MRSIIIIVVGYFTITFAAGIEAASPLAAQLQSHKSQLESIMEEM